MLHRRAAVAALLLVGLLLPVMSWLASAGSADQFPQRRRVVAVVAAQAEGSPASVVENTLIEEPLVEEFPAEVASEDGEGDEAVLSEDEVFGVFVDEVDQQVTAAEEPGGAGNVLTATPSATATVAVDTPTNTATATATIAVDTPTNTATATATVAVDTPTNTATATATVAVDTPTNTATSTATVAVDTPTSTATATIAADTPTNTATSTATIVPDPPTMTPSATATVAVDTPTNTATVTASSTPTDTPTGTPVTPTNTSTATSTATVPATPTSAPTATSTVTPEPLVAVDDEATTDEDTAVTVDVLTNDQVPSGQSATVISAGPASNGTVVVNPDGTVTYLPAIGFVGVDSFPYTITAGVIATEVGAAGVAPTSTAIVTITVVGVDGTPILDTDDDGLADDEDNCVDDANADQADADGDGLGDVCDPTPDGDPTATSLPVVRPTATTVPVGLPNTGVGPSDQTDGGISWPWIILLASAGVAGIGVRRRRVSLS